jgi:predicted Co/Zn/Cd cation transporter (cation efflux family)
VFTTIVPVRMAVQAAFRLLNRAPSREMVEHTTAIIRAALHPLPVTETFVRMLEPGQGTRLVLVHVVLPSEFRVERLAALDATRARVTGALQEENACTEVDIVFTTDRVYGALAPAAVFSPPSPPLAAPSQQQPQ